MTINFADLAYDLEKVGTLSTRYDFLWWFQLAEKKEDLILLIEKDFRQDHMACTTEKELRQALDQIEEKIRTDHFQGTFRKRARQGIVLD